MGCVQSSDEAIRRQENMKKRKRKDGEDGMDGELDWGSDGSHDHDDGDHGDGDGGGYDGGGDYGGE